MNKNIGAAIVVFLVLIIVWALFSSTPRLREANIIEQKEAVTDKENTIIKGGTYENYSPEKISTAAANGKVVLFFRANWCPICRGLDVDIREHAKNIPENLTILDVDYDNSSQLKKKYGVTYQHTMVQVDKDGNMIKKWMGSPTLAAFIKEIK